MARPVSSGRVARPVIGLVGQICAGKSAVAASLWRRGAEVYDADHFVHEIYQQPEVIEQVRRLFGAETVQAGKVDRKALGRIVFTDPEKLKTLTEQVVFPRTAVAMQQAIAAFGKSATRALVLDAPTLFEAGRDGLCSHILFVAAPLARRQEWAKARGWTVDELARRESRMLDENFKRQRADVVLDNDGTLNALDAKAGEMLDRWTRVN